MNPYAVGAVVTYHGTYSDGTDKHWVITGHGDPQEMATWYPQIPGEGVAEAYPDGVAYEIWPVDVEQRFANRSSMVTRVRRGSITPVD